MLIVRDGFTIDELRAARETEALFDALVHVEHLGNESGNLELVLAAQNLLSQFKKMKRIPTEKDWEDLVMRVSHVHWKSEHEH